MKISRYSKDDFGLWNDINRHARNGHILFDRNFMDYHGDRFVDYSLIIRDDDTPVALLPANYAGETVYSHQGLTFGGFILSDRMGACRIVQAFEESIAHFKADGLSRLVYKAIPAIYHIRPAADDLYGLFRLGAQLVRRDVSTTIDYRERGAISSRRKRGVKKAHRHGITYGESDSWDAFWSILTATLTERHGVTPVHSLQEMLLLARRFPNEIRLFTAFKDGAVVAGTVVFETPTVAHAQYISSSPYGRDTGALDGLFEFVIQNYHNTKRFFDFGISSEEGGRSLNEGLLTQKEEFGGSTIIHDVYELRW